MQNLMELDYGWSTLDNAFIFKVVQILSSPHLPHKRLQTRHRYS